MRSTSQILRAINNGADQEILDVEIKVVIADDEPLARQLLISLANGQPCIDVVGIADNGAVASRIIKETRPDLVFLDVNMPKISGVELAELLKQTSPNVLIVFVTAYNQFATRAFDLDALDYLVKPVNIERFEKTIERAKRAIMAQRVEQLGKQIAEVSTTDIATADIDTPHVVIKQRDELIQLSEDNIFWLEAASQYVNIHTDNDRYVVAEPLKHYFAKLQSDSFKRVHRSAVVNVKKVRKIRRKPNGVHELELLNGVGVPLSRSRKMLVEELLNAASENVSA